MGYAFTKRAVGAAAKGVGGACQAREASEVEVILAHTQRRRTKRGNEGSDRRKKKNVLGCHWSILVFFTTPG